MTDHGSSRDSRSLAFRVRRASPTLDFAKWWASGESTGKPAPTRSFLAVSFSWLGAGIALGAAGCIGGPGVRVAGAVGAAGMRACGGPAGGVTGGADDPPWAGVRPPGSSVRTGPCVVSGGGCGPDFARLSGRRLRTTNLSSARLSGWRLRTTNLSSARLSGRRLRTTNLSSARLSGRRLRTTNLSSARLSGRRLRTTNLSGRCGCQTCSRGSAGTGGGAMLCLRLRPRLSSGRRARLRRLASLLPRRRDRTCRGSGCVRPTGCGWRRLRGCYLRLLYRRSSLAALRPLGLSSKPEPGQKALFGRGRRRRIPYGYGTLSRPCTGRR